MTGPIDPIRRAANARRALAAPKDSDRHEADGEEVVFVRDEEEAGMLCAFVRHGGDADALVTYFGDAVSPGFDPRVHLERIGCANQTTMLMSESLRVGEMLRAAIADRYGEAVVAERFRAFDTICSATQERQDAVISLLDTEAIDLMLVVGGYNSSNTCNLARICAERVPTYHIAGVDRLVSPDCIRHRPVPPSDQPMVDWKTASSA